MIDFRLPSVLASLSMTPLIYGPLDQPFVLLRDTSSIASAKLKTRVALFFGSILQLTSLLINKTLREAVH